VGWLSDLFGSPRGVYFGNFQDEHKAETPVHYNGPLGMITLGPPGSGKGMTLLVPNLARLNRSILVIDPKGELAAITGKHRRKFGPVIVLNPFGVLLESSPFKFLKSEGFNPISALNPASDLFVDDAASIAEGLIRIDEHQPYFGEGARALIAASLMHLRRTVGANASFDMMRKMICAPTQYGTDKRGKTDIVGGFLKDVEDMARCGFVPIENKVGRFLSSTEGLTECISTAISQTDFLDSPPISRDLVGGHVDFAAMKRKTVTVYVILPARELDKHANWLRLVVTTALNALTSSPPTERPPVLFMLDEFAQLGYIRAIENAMGMVRGYGVQIWPILQDATQLQAIYRDRWETFLGTAGMISAFTPNDMTTAKYLSERSGQREIIVQRRDKPAGWFNFNAGSHSWGPQPAPLYSPQDLLGMASGRMICFKQGLQHPFFTRTPIYKDVSGCGHLPTSPYYKGR
jgi:type IV secretion system protein VirD4